MKILHSFTALALLTCSSLSFASDNSNDIQNKLISYCATPQMNITKTETVTNVTAITLNQNGYMLVAKTVNDPIINNRLLQLSQQALLPNNCMEYLTSSGLMAAKADDKLLARLYFKFDSHELTPESRHIINMVIERLDQQPNIIRITGNTDNIGKASYNQILGLQRAQTTAVALKQQTLADNKMVIQSNGEDSPIASNASAAGRYKNRRVDITL